ncbi:hypothetical protein DSL72_008049 [Monilinia vaccinii-corymbosi]|uniref:Uncharacterized protein n=1 Tax=Monilinia vaccinii-corymbosi TaxID=61207 RepID=A0A8A3PIS9_9HELO|nr:hypothetical protein DSL72_008049 [Monilinia vaccinii-corymbosi]
MPIIWFTQDPLRTSADFVAPTTTPTTRSFIQERLATPTSTTTNWFPPTTTIKANTTIEPSAFTSIQTLIKSLLYREPLDPLPTLSNLAPTNAIAEPSINVHSGVSKVGKFPVTSYNLMYLVALCVCFVILMSFCCCTDDLGRYIKSKNKAGATVHAAPVWPAAFQFMDGANDTRTRNGNSRGLSTDRSSMPQLGGTSDPPGPSTTPRNPFTKITIKTCEEGHKSIIIDEIELRDLPSEHSNCDLSSSKPDFTHEYVTTNPQAQNGKVSLRGGSGTQGDLSDSFMRTGAITSFKQTEERWKPTWSAAKSLFSTRRRESEPAPGITIGYPMLGFPTQSDSIYPAPSGDRFDQKHSTTASKRESRQTTTSGTAFSFPLSDGSDSEIPRFPTINRIKRKLKPLIHSVSKQSLRERLSSIDHSKDQGTDPSTDETDSYGLVYSSTVRKALRRARSSASVPFGLFRLPDPARDDPEPSDAGPVSILAHHSGSEYSDTASENTARARSPVSTLLGVDTKRGPGSAGSGSVSKGRGSRRVVVPLGSYEGVVDEVGLGAARAFSNLRSCEMREKKKKMMASRPNPASGKESKSQDKQEDEYEEKDYVGGSRDNEAKEESYATHKSVNSSQEENQGGATETEQEQSETPIPSYMNSTRSGHVRRYHKRGHQTAMANHFHARRTRAGMDSTDGSGSLVTERREKMKRGLGLLMIREVAGGDGEGLGARRDGNVEWVTMNLGSDY